MSKGYRKRFRKSHRRHEYDLPEPIIQAVQSFLTSKEAARTTLISKSWRSAWLTRPDLDFDQADFCHPEIDYRYNTEQLKFLDFADKALRRYEDLELKIDSFRLNLKSMIARGCGYGAPKLIRRALKLGPTRLTFEAQSLCDLIIPDEVLRYENLLSLNVTKCSMINFDQELRCSRLRFLSLEILQLKRHDTILHVLKCCPLIEKLSSLCKIYAQFDVDSSCPRTINRHRLKSLVLKHGDMETMFLDDLSSKFPFLKDLTLHIGRTGGIEEILISSPTLEHLDFSMADSRVPVKLDVPSIRKLTFDCTLSFPDELHVRSNSRGWESCVYVTCDCLTASWFDRLSRFLRKFRSSRIYLSLHVHSRHTFDYEAGEVRGLPKLEIENLEIYHVHLPTLTCYALFDGLFRMCRPKRITQYMPNNALSICRPEAKNIRFLGKIISDALDAKVPMSYQFMYGLNDLKDARIEVLDDGEFSEDFGERQSEEPIQFRHQKVRFRLYWKM